MRSILATMAIVTLTMMATTVLADRETEDYSETINMFKENATVVSFFDSAYGYAVFPKIAKGGLMYEASIGGQKYGFEPIE